MSPSEQAKVCAGCGADVTSTQRVKDAKGRYLCAGCVERIRARQGGARRVTNVEGTRATSSRVAGPGQGHAPASDQGADLREFMKQAKEAARNQCPSCGVYAQPGAVICLNCGYDARSQSQLQTKFGTARAAKVKGGSGGGGGGATLDNQTLAGAPAIAWALICTGTPLWLAFGSGNLDAASLATAPNAIAAFVLWVCWLVSFYGRKGVGTGILVTIVTLIVLPVGELIACAYFNKEGSNRLLRWFAGAVAISILAAVIVSGYTVYQTVSTEMQNLNAGP